jgi:hypothetical protein
MSDDLPHRSLDGADRFPRSRLVQILPAFGRRGHDSLIRLGKGSIPFVRLKWRCGNCRSDLTDFVMTGSHFGPANRADLSKIGS